MALKSRLLRSLFIYLFILVSTQLVNADTFIVTNTNNSEAGSLSQAIIDARDNAGADTIIFNIPDTDAGYESDKGIWRIRLSAGPPEMWTDSTLIDGFSQANFIGGDPNPNGPEIVIDGHEGGPIAGFSIGGSNNELRGLVIHQFQFDPVTLHGDSNRITGCYIGPDATGENRFPNSHNGISVYGDFNIVGGHSDEERNIIAGNGHNGMMVGNGASYNQIIGNFIGVNSSGSDTLSNREGIRVSGHANSNQIGPGNVISGNSSAAIIFQINSDSNLVIGNLIGTDPSGTLDFGNDGSGIYITSESSSNIIGGPLEEFRNIVSGNGGYGIYITKTNSDSNIVIGNYVGTDINGVQSISNDDGGIFLNSGCKYNTVGGTNVGEGNVISGNLKTGVVIRGEGTEENSVTGNYIGVASDGTSALPNEEHGIAIKYKASNHVIGPLNIIAYNGENGVQVYDSDVFGNMITQNSIYNNSAEGIYIGGIGNRGIEAPVITSVISGVEGTTIPSGFVEIFSDSAGQGRIFEDSFYADTEGNFSWPGSPVGPYVTATVTDDSGNTSAFSLQLFLHVENKTLVKQPVEFALHQNYPNPFNPETNIQFHVKRQSHVILRVYNVMGQQVNTLADKIFQKGEYQIRFNSKGLTSGIYFYSIQIGDFRAARKMVVLE